MMFDRCERIRPYLQGKIDSPEDASEGTWIDEHLAECAACRGEFERTRAMLGLLHSLPRREPVLDLWREMEPALAEARRERRMGPVARLRARFARFASNAAAGAIVFTDQVARNTDSALRRFLVQDPFLAEEEA